MKLLHYLFTFEWLFHWHRTAVIRKRLEEI